MQQKDVLEEKQMRRFLWILNVRVVILGMFEAAVAMLASRDRLCSVSINSRKRHAEILIRRLLWVHREFVCIGRPAHRGDCSIVDAA